MRFVFSHAGLLGEMRRRRGFALVEVLISMLILGVGLIMVASMLPVGADWTRQNAEETITATIAHNAETIIRVKYSAADFPVATYPTFSTVDYRHPTFYPLPGISDGSRLPLVERTYAFGRDSTPYPCLLPGSGTSYSRGDSVKSGSNCYRCIQSYTGGFAAGDTAHWIPLSTDPSDPASDPTKSALYFWTAVFRRSPICNTNSSGTPASTGYRSDNRFDVYILVFKKGDASQTFTGNTDINPYYAGGTLFTSGGNYYQAQNSLTGGYLATSLTAPNWQVADVTTFANCRIMPTETWVPQITVVGTAVAPFGYAYVPYGAMMIDLPNTSVAYPANNWTDGWVLRNGNGANTTTITGTDKFLSAPPPDGNSPISPLVYIYATTLSF